MIYFAGIQALLSQEKLNTYHKSKNNLIFSVFKILFKMEWIKYWKNMNVPENGKSQIQIFSQTLNIFTDK